jgi:hypothetical protein
MFDPDEIEIDPYDEAVEREIINYYRWLTTVSNAVLIQHEGAECARCHRSRMTHSIEPPYDTADCEGFSYIK